MNASPLPDHGYDAERVWRDFPILRREVHGKPLVFLDSAASSQRPASVIAAVDRYETRHHANVHRGVHQLSQEATGLFEQARERVRGFVHAASVREVIFTRGTTESVNLVAQSWGRANLRPGDEILLTGLEHHANIVPWQLVAAQTGARIQVAPLDRRGVVGLDAFAHALSDRTRMVACSHVSNALGTVLPVKEFTRLAHQRGAVVLVDGAQAVPHQSVDVADIGCDFYAFSGHKMYGPTGIGVLIGREQLLESMPPWQGGGDMILTVTFDRSTYNALPFKFEAGTPNISGAVGLAAAIDYLEALGIDAVHAHEQRLLRLATAELERVPGLTIIGTAPQKASVISFVCENIHPHDLGTILDAEGVAIRTGHHCAMPVMDFFDVPATARASFACYTRDSDIHALVAALSKAREVFA